MSENQPEQAQGEAPKPWNDERAIAEAEALVADWPILHETARHILRWEIVGLLRQQASADGRAFAVRVMALQAENAALRRKQAEREMLRAAAPGPVLIEMTPERIAALEYLIACTDNYISQHHNDRETGAAMIAIARGMLAELQSKEVSDGK